LLSDFGERLVQNKLHDNDPHGLAGPHLRRTARRQAEEPHFAFASADEAAADEPRGVESVDRARLQQQTLHMQLARALSTALSTQLRAPVQFSLTAVEKTTFGDFAARQPNPACASIVRAGPLEPTWIIALHPPVFFAMMDRLLGGGREPVLLIRRPLTEIELRLAARITRLITEQIAKCWSSMITLSFEVERVESDPRLLLAAARDESLLEVRFEARINEVHGPVSICLPEGLSEQIEAGMDGHGVATRAGSSMQMNAVLVSVDAAEATLTAAEVANLRVGDLIATDTSADAPFIVRVAGIDRFHARAGAIEGHKAIRIEAPIDPPNS
ncbi:MAG TPA: flagellar motor switch protein FliM, partial [Pirellulales bacterium]